MKRLTMRLLIGSLLVALLQSQTAFANGEHGEHGEQAFWDPGHPLVGDAVGTPYPYETDIARNPMDVPDQPLPDGGAVTITAHELDTFLSPKDRASEWAGDGSDVQHHYFAFGGGQTNVQGPKVPAPFLKVIQGNEVTVKLENPGGNEHTHSIDLHAALGKKGGAAVLMAEPGQEKTYTFTPKDPGIYLYHCVGNGSPFGIARHMNNGMYGLILVLPREGQGTDGGPPFVSNDRSLPPPFASGDQPPSPPGLGNSQASSFRAKQQQAKEAYVFQSDLYHESAEEGAGGFDEEAMLKKEAPNYVVYNGRVGSLVDHPIQGTIGQDLIIYHGNAGQRTASSHIIGERWDQVWDDGSLLSKPLLDVQTASIPSAGAIAALLDGDKLTPTDLQGGDLNILVDHALPAFRKGALGLLVNSAQ